MATEVIVTDEFVAWYGGLSEVEQDRVSASIGLLEARGVTLPFPYAYLEETGQKRAKK